jgi:hypothetical protein
MFPPSRTISSSFSFKDDFDQTPSQSSTEKQEEPTDMSDFVADGYVGNVDGKFHELKIHNLLQSADTHYYQYMFHDQNTMWMSVKFDQLRVSSEAPKLGTIGEVDDMVSGNAIAFEQ